MTFLKDRVRAFLSEGKKVIIFFEIPSAQKATNPYKIEHISIGPFQCMVYFSFDGRMKVFAPSELHDHVSTHNNILGVTLSADFCDVCTLSDLRPNHSWATPHKIARPPLPKKLIPFLTIFLLLIFLTSLEGYVIMWT